MWTFSGKPYLTLSHTLAATDALIPNRARKRQYQIMVLRQSGRWKTSSAKHSNRAVVLITCSVSHVNRWTQFDPVLISKNRFCNVSTVFFSEPTVFTLILAYTASAVCHCCHVCLHFLFSLSTPFRKHVVSVYINLTNSKASDIPLNVVLEKLQYATVTQHFKLLQVVAYCCTPFATESYRLVNV